MTRRSMCEQHSGVSQPGIVGRREPDLVRNPIVPEIAESKTCHQNPTIPECQICHNVTPEIQIFATQQFQNSRFDGPDNSRIPELN